jgi:CRP-like cAMP-binding protein
VAVGASSRPRRSSTGIHRLVACADVTPHRPDVGGSSFTTSGTAMTARPARPRARVDRGRNRLLTALSRDAYVAIAPLLETVAVTSGQVLHEPLAIVKTVYFPETAVLSLIAQMDAGSAIEVGTVGNEGFVGLGVLHGVDRSPTQCVAQVPGLVRAMSARALRAALAGGGPLRTTLLHYAHAYLHQVGQRLACSASHTVLERCARWLLAADDTAGHGTASVPRGFLLTQEYLAYMLGVRREGVSAAETSLRDAGVIAFSRGRIEVLDRRGLEAASCSCYASVNREYRRVMGVGAVIGRA